VAHLAAAEWLRQEFMAFFFFCFPLPAPGPSRKGKGWERVQKSLVLSVH